MSYRMSTDHRQHYLEMNDPSIPSYYKRRASKQAVQPTTFEMQTDQDVDGDNLKNATFTTEHRSRTFGAFGRGKQTPSAFARTYNGNMNSEYENAKRDAEHTLLQNVIKQLEGRLQEKAAELD